MNDRLLGLVQSALAGLLVLTASQAGAQSLVSSDDAFVEECPDCGKNAATVGDGIIFDKMHFPVRRGVAGEPNSGGVRVRANGTRYCLGGIDPPVDCQFAVLRVIGDRLTAQVDGRIIRGEDLVQKVIIDLEHTDGAHYELRITGAPRVDFRFRPECSGAGPCFAGQVVTYEFMYRMVDAPASGRYLSRRPDELFHLCTGTPADEEAPYSAVLYEGTWLDNRSKTVVDGAREPGWFNLACNGTALAKLHLFRHTGAAALAGLTSDPLQWQTLLKLLTADYCGTGVSFTMNGQPLRFTDSQQRLLRAGRPIDLTDPDDRNNIEAIWGPGGAICLNKPRLPKYHPTLTRLSCALAQRHPVIEPDRGVIVGPRPPRRPTFGTRECTPDDLRDWADRHYMLSVINPKGG